MISSGFLQALLFSHTVHSTQINPLYQPSNVFYLTCCHEQSLQREIPVKYPSVSSWVWSCSTGNYGENIRSGTWIPDLSRSSKLSRWLKVIYFPFYFPEYLQATRIQIPLLVSVPGVPYSLSSRKDSWCMTSVNWTGGFIVLLVVRTPWITVLRKDSLVQECKSVLNPGIHLGLRTV